MYLYIIIINQYCTTGLIRQTTRVPLSLTITFFSLQDASPDAVGASADLGAIVESDTRERSSCSINEAIEERRAAYRLRQAAWRMWRFERPKSSDSRSARRSSEPALNNRAQQ